MILWDIFGKNYCIYLLRLRVYSEKQWNIMGKNYGIYLKKGYIWINCGIYWAKTIDYFMDIYLAKL